MTSVITHKMLVDWAGPQVVAEAEAMVDKGLVLEASFEPPVVKGAVLWSNHPLRTGFRILDGGMIESLCPCRVNRERGLICPHVIALGAQLVRRAADPLREARYQEERRHAARMASFSEKDYIRRAPAETAGACPARLSVTLSADWMPAFRRGIVPIACHALYRGQRVPLDEVPRQVPFNFDKRDENLLYVLEDISEGPPGGCLDLGRADFLNLLKLHEGQTLAVEDGAGLLVHDTPLATYVRMDLDPASGELVLKVHTEVPVPTGGTEPFHLVHGNAGWVHAASDLWPLEAILPGPYHSIYVADVRVGRPDVLRFVRTELRALSRHARIESDIAEDLFTVEPAQPHFRLAVSGSPASLSAVLYADYGLIELVAALPDSREGFGIPDPEDLMRYEVRNLPAERHAMEILSLSGFRGETGNGLGSIVGNREVLNFLSGAIPSLRRRGWRVELQGRVEPYFDGLDFVTPVVHIADAPGQEWFDVGFDFEDARGASISGADVQLALRRGDAFIKRGDRTVLIDADAVNSMHDVFADCATADGERPGHFRLAGVFAPFVEASLGALDGVDVEETAAMRDRAARGNRVLTVEPVPLRPELEALLRSYQKDGVNWLRFLQTNGFCGILADEMGLGKTVETLAWIEVLRAEPEAKGKPVLIVCPSSLVENWAEEAARFTPSLKVLALSGADRHAKLGLLPERDIAVTSYALLRRDIDRLVEHEFSALILDEAQHIKNRSTQNALAAKRVRASHRLVLTGTPMENSVSDLWSIMDFLMPGYLGPHEAFRQNYELPIGRQRPESDLALAKLRRKLHPFMLRRRRADVARDLPPKIESISRCSLTPDQKVVYAELLASSRRKIGQLVAKHGFSATRMEILTTLMRLRQACCHLELLQLPNLQAQNPSAKLEQFLELLDEAMDSGHRMLVFSQFVTMLRIVERELQSRGVAYCYLDGSTKERMKVVHQFNTERQIPAFLISLKAGGTGLNLTGADMVVHFDPWWNPAVEQQATDRAYRIGQKRTVYSIKLITRGTVEEKVLELQARKQSMINAAIDSDEGVMDRLTWDDVRELLEL